VLQGMNGSVCEAWHNHKLSVWRTSSYERPSTGYSCMYLARIHNLTATEAAANRACILDIARQDPAEIIKGFTRLIMPSHHDVRSSDVDLKRLGALLYVTQEAPIDRFEDLLLLRGVGPRTLQSLALVSEVIHGAPARFADPARFSFAHGGKDGHPFPVPINVYDQSIELLKKGIEQSKLGNAEK